MCVSDVHVCDRMKRKHLCLKFNVLHFLSSFFFACIDFHLAVFTAPEAHKQHADAPLVEAWAAMSHQSLTQGHH